MCIRDRDYPYLIGKIDPYEASVVDRISNYNWTVTYTAQELTELLQSKGYGNSTIVDFRVTKTSPTGNAIEITFTDANGRSWSKTREACRTFLGLRSQHYTISGGSGGGYAVNGTGSDVYKRQAPRGGRLLQREQHAAGRVL